MAGANERRRRLTSRRRSGAREVEASGNVPFWSIRSTRDYYLWVLVGVVLGAAIIGVAALIALATG